MTKRRLAILGAFSAGCVAVLAACGNEISRPVVAADGPLVISGAGEVGMVSGGWGDNGITEPYREDWRFGLLFSVKNRTSEPLTLLSVSEPQEGPRLLHLIGVVLSLAPKEDPNPDRPGYGPWGPEGEVEPEPVKIPPNREALVQLNFQMGDCEFFPPKKWIRYNEAATFTYLLNGKEAATTLDLDAQDLAVTIKAPNREHCPAATSRTDTNPEGVEDGQARP